MISSDVLAALSPVADALEALGARYYVGGSLASSVHGVPRASIDADVVTDLGADQVGAFVARLQAAYYVDETRARAAIQARRSFNLIHLATMFKVDMFVSKGRPFDLEALRRASLEPLIDSPDARRFFVATPEDTILAKLEWFRAGGEASERQWTDVVGLLKTGRGRVARDYLERWAAATGVTDLLERAFRDASGK